MEGKAQVPYYHLILRGVSLFCNVVDNWEGIEKIYDYDFLIIVSKTVLIDFVSVR